MGCNSELSFSVDPLSLSTSRQQLNLGLEKGMKSLLKAEWWRFLKKDRASLQVNWGFLNTFCVVLQRS